MTYDARLYRLVHRGSPGDETFYERVCRDADSVLVLAAGWGRMLPKLDAPGRRLAAVERNPELLGMAREELSADIQLIEADLVSFDAGARFDRILVPHNGLWSLENEEEVLECFRRVRDHLAPGGLFIFDTVSLDGLHGSLGPDDNTALDHVVTIDDPEGETFDVYERRQWEPEAQRLVVSYAYVPRSGGPDREGTVLHHYLLRPQVEQLLSLSGLRAERVEGGFAGEPWSPEAGHLVVTATRPETN